MKITTVIRRTNDSPTIPLIHNRLAIVSWLPLYMSDPSWAFEVNAVELSDVFPQPTRMGKGHTIPVLPPVLAYEEKIQTHDAFDLMKSPGHLRINHHYIGDGTGTTGGSKYPMAECIHAGYGNFIEIIRTVQNAAGTWHEIKAIRYDDPMNYDPARFNWFTHPTVFSKETCRTPENRIVNPGDGKDCFFTVIKREPCLWIHGSFVELFPPMPPGVRAYALRGASVYGWTGDGYIPLRIAERPGQLEHPTPGWRLKTGSVIPQA